MSLELTTCPECGAPAEVIKRFVLSSTDGPVEHVKTRCVTGPWFTYPATAIDAAPRGGSRPLLGGARRGNHPQQEGPT
jgi:hypothetical protein